MAPMDQHTSRPEFAAGTASEALRRLEDSPPRFPHALAFAWIVGAGLVDYLTGDALSAAFLYAPAVAGMGWLLGRRQGVWTAVAAALVGLLADWPVPGVAGLVVTAVWNAGVAGVLLAAIGFLAGEIRAHRDEMRHVVQSDPLTGLHNRGSLLVALEAERARAERFGGDTSLVCIAVDGFRQINDRDGHAAGDAFLKALAAELGEIVRRTDLVARIGGDEFAVLLTQTGAASVQSVAQKLTESLTSWAALKGYCVGFSVGWASAPLAGMEAEQLLSHATATLYERKRANRVERTPPPVTGTTAAA